MNVNLLNVYLDMSRKVSVNLNAPFQTAENLLRIKLEKINLGLAIVSRRNILALARGKREGPYGV
jgi:hypothetical protein